MTSIKDRLLAIIDSEERTDPPAALHLQYIADHMRTPTVTADERGLITGVNRAARYLFGYSFDELRGQPITILMASEMAAQHLAAFHSRVDEELAAHVPNMVVKDKCLRGVAVRKDGTRIRVTVRLSSYRYNGSITFAASVEPDDDASATT